MVAAAFIFTAATSFAQGIATDKLNYQPGEKVAITGQGWQAMEPVSLTIGDTSGKSEPVVIKVTAGATGEFKNSSFVMRESDRDKMLIVTARGGVSGVETMIAFKDSGTRGVLSCSSLTPRDSNHYGLAPGQTVTCSIEGAMDLSAAQLAGDEPLEVMVRSSVLGNRQAKIVSVLDDTIVFEYTAPDNASGASLVSYGPISACDPKTDRCVTFPTEGNNAGLSGSTGAAGFRYLYGPEPVAMAAVTPVEYCYPSTCPAQLKVDKIPQNGSFTEGAKVTFQIVVSNPATVGAASATNVKLTDQLPGLGGLVWQTATTTQGSCVNPISGNALSCTLGTIAPQQSVTVTVSSTSTTPLAACVCQPNPNAIATADGGLVAYGSGTLNCTPTPQLRVVKSPDNGTFTQGGQVKYIIYVKNPGSMAINNVQLTDVLPTNGGLTWTSVTSSPVGTCSITGNTLNCNIGSIPAARTVTVTVMSPATTPPEACQPQPNPAAIATADGGLRAQDSGSQSCTPTSNPPQLRVVKTPDNGTFLSGGQLTYTIVVSNPAPAGSAAATNVMLNDVLPTAGGLTWISSTTTQGSCSIGSNTLNCSLGTIAAGASVTVTVSSPATTPSTACQYQPNPAAIATASGGLTAQDSGSMTCSTTPPPQLRVVKTPDNGTFTQGGQVRYTIVVSNPAPIGAASAMNVVLTDQLPTNGGLTWSTWSISPSGSCSITGNVLNCNIPSIAPQGSVTVNVYSPTTTPASACQPQPNPVALATANGGLTAQDSGYQSCTPTTPPQLRVVKTPDNGIFSQGAQVTYTIVVSNPAPAGSATAMDVRLTDSLPTNGGLTWTGYTTSQGTCSITNSVLSCTLGNLAAGASATVTVSSPATTPASACQSQPNSAAVATALGGLTAQDSGSLSCTPQGPPQLRVVKTPDNGTFTVNGQVVFTIVVSNPAPAGSAAATNVMLTDGLPTNGGLTWISTATTQGTCGLTGNVLNCSLGTLAAGASATVNVFSPATTPAAACTTQPNPSAVATADGGLTAQDSGSVTCSITPPPQLRVAKTPDNGTFTQGGRVVYTIRVSNPALTGAASANNVVLTDVLPTNGGLTWTTATVSPVGTGTCTITGNTLNCTIPTIPAQRSVTITVASPITTPPEACQPQPNPAAVATADGGLRAQDSGSISCTSVPASLGDRVWRDLNGNGIQDCQDTNNNGIIGDVGDIGTECSAAGVPGVTVNLVNCQTPSTILATTQTDANGFYLFQNLTAGQYCVRFNASTIPASVCVPGMAEFTTPDVGANDAFDSDANPVTGLAPAVTVVSGQANRTVDAGVVCRSCPIAVDKTCLVQTPPTSNFVCSNAKPIDSISMIWTGQNGIYIRAWKGAVGSTLLSTQGPIATGQRVTVTGMGGSPLDQYWQIFSGPPDAGGTLLGLSDFHISCSDVDMNGPEDCGKFEGNAKTTSTTLINLWKFDGMAGNGQVLTCTPTSPTGQDACTVTGGPAPSCQSLGAKPKILAFRYTGSDCSASRNNQAADKWFCSGVPGTNPLITIIKDPARITVSPATGINVGDIITVAAIGSDMGAEIQLQVGGQSLKIHTSCSQPLAVGDVFGSFELVQFNGQGVGAQVTYSYAVKNNGNAPVDISSVADDKLGELLTQPTTVAAGATLTLQKSSFISQTTTNVVTATGRFAGTTNVCGQARDQVTVTVGP